MDSTSQPTTHTCPVCESTWRGQGDYCPECGAPISEAAKAAQLADTRGCQFFMLMIFCFFFFFIGIALTVVGVTAKSHDDPVAVKFFAAGLGLITICALGAWVVVKIFGPGATAAGRALPKDDRK